MFGVPVSTGFSVLPILLTSANTEMRMCVNGDDLQLRHTLGQSVEFHVRSVHEER